MILLILLLLLLAAFVWYGLVKNAPLGHEDDDGFHYDKDDE